MATAPLPVQYEKLFKVVEDLAPEAGTINNTNSWAHVHPVHNAAACVELLEHHLGAKGLSVGQTRLFRQKWAAAVEQHVLNSVDTCLGRTGDGLQCEELVPVNEISGVCAAHKGQILLKELEVEFGVAHEAPCLVCHHNFDKAVAVSCLMCFQKVHAEGCWDELFKKAGMNTPTV